MENNPLRALFGVSSPRPEPKLATPQHSYLSKRATIDPLYLWVIKAIFWRRYWGVKHLW